MVLRVGLITILLRVELLTAVALILVVGFVGAFSTLVRVLDVGFVVRLFLCHSAIVLAG